jgi:hypothetical protein
LPAHSDVEMRARGAARAAAQRDDLPAFHRIAFFHFEFGKMHVDGEQALAVIEYDEVAFEIKRASQQDGAVIHGLDGSSAWDAEIQTPVSARGLAIENALRAEDVGNRGVRWLGERARPLAIWRDAVQIILLDLLALLDLFLLLGSGLGELAFDAEFGLDFWILARGNGELVTERNFLAGHFACLRFAGQIKGVGSRSGLEADARECDPCLALRIEAERDFVSQPCSSQRFHPLRGLYLKQHWPAIHQTRGLRVDCPVCSRGRRD